MVSKQKTKLHSLFLYFVATFIFKFSQFLSVSEESAGDLRVVELEPDRAAGGVVALVRVLPGGRHDLVAVRPERHPKWLHLGCARKRERERG